MLYFAYGSNLSSQRLLQRVPSARLLCAGRLHHHKLHFHKIGRDGSGKCNAFYTGEEDNLIYGAIYKINPRHKKYLDEAEGLGNGYEIKQVRITIQHEQVITAFTYFATRIAWDVKPFHWYKEHVLAGAREHCLPQNYINLINDIESLKDSNRERTDKELSIYAEITSQINIT